jgi:uncharacterized membrane protein
MKRNFIFGLTFFCFAIFAAYGSNGPLQTIISKDGRIEIINLMTTDYTLPGFRVNGGDWQSLTMPENLAGKAVALSGNGNVICGLIHEQNNYIPTESLIRRAVAWRTDDTAVEKPEFSLLELSLLSETKYSSALNTSENGKYIIGICQDEPFGNPQACYWDEYGIVYSLGTMIYNSFVSESTYPHSVSNTNVVVGTAISADAGYQLAFIWDQINGMRYLTDVLEADYGYDFSGCILSQAFNITSDGQTIDGYGYDNNGNHFDWIVVIPEPASMLLLAAGAAWLRKRK